MVAFILQHKNRTARFDAARRGLGELLKGSGHRHGMPERRQRRGGPDGRVERMPDAGLEDPQHYNYYVVPACQDSQDSAVETRYKTVWRKGIRQVRGWDRRSLLVGCRCRDLSGRMTDHERRWSVLPLGKARPQRIGSSRGSRGTSRGCSRAPRRTPRLLSSPSRRACGPCLRPSRWRR